MGQSTDLLVIVLLVAIVAVILDGLRRKWRDRQERVVVKIDKSLLRGLDNTDDDLLTSSELPNGGARTVPRVGDIPPPRRYGPRLKNGKRRESSEETPVADRGKPEAVPVLMDTVEVDETDIEHANVFASTEPPQQFTPEEFDDELAPAQVRSNSNVVEDKEMLDAQIEGLEQLRRDPLAPEAGRKSRFGDDDEDEFEDDDEEFEDDDFEDDDDDDDFDDDDFDDEDDFDEEDDDYPRRRRRLDDDEDDDEWEDDEDEDEDDDWDDDEDEEDDEDEDEDWDDEDEDEQYSADYENEPALLEETYTRAASAFKREPEPPQARIEPGFGEGDAELGDLSEEELAAENFDEAFEDVELYDNDLREFRPDPITAAELKEVAEAEEQAAKAEVAPVKAPEKKAKSTAKENKDKRGSFFSKSLLGREKQVDLFADEEPVEEEVAEIEAEDEGPREVVIINVMARQGYHFHGSDLLAVVREQGLQLGDMSIFHRHEKPDGSGRVVFSMANIVKPGTFDLATMDQFSTPGVSLFLQLPNKYGNMAAFELMLETALVLREQLDGELKDENRSVFTRQTIEHVRQRIRDFELALQLAARR